MTNFQRVLAIIVFFTIVATFNIGVYLAIQSSHESTRRADSNGLLYQMRNATCQSEIAELQRKEFQCKKGNELQQIANRIGKIPYVYGVYDCFGHTIDLAEELRGIDIETVIFEGVMNNIQHFWVGIMMDAVTGEYISLTDDYTIKGIRNSKNERLYETKRATK